MKLFAHRGLPGYNNQLSNPYTGVKNPRPGENTLTSFKRSLALAHKPFGVECDVRLTKDGVAVICHDGAIDRTTNGRGAVRDFTLDELKKFDAGAGASFSDHIPTLDEVLVLFKDHPDCVLNLELKEDDPLFLCEVVRLLRENDVENSVVVSAFPTEDNEEGASSSWESLTAFRPPVRTAILVDWKKWCLLRSRFLTTRKSVVALVETALRFGAHAINPGDRIVTPALVDTAHDAGLEVFVWTVNEPQRAAELLRWGVDGIFTDCADNPELQKLS